MSTSGTPVTFEAIDGILAEPNESFARKHGLAERSVETDDGIDAENNFRQRGLGTRGTTSRGAESLGMKIRGSFKRSRRNDEILPGTAMLTPDGPFVEKWDIVMLILLSYTALVTTYEIAFIEDTPISLQSGLFVANRVVDCGFLIDIGVNFNLAYYDEANRIVSSIHRVRMHYLKGWFSLDVISMLPYGLLMIFRFAIYGLLIFFTGCSAGMLGSITGDEKTKNMKSMRLIRLLRLIKLTRMLRASRIVTRIIQKAYFNMSTWAFLNTFVLLGVAFHWSSCVWMILANVEGAYPNWQTQFKEGEAGDDDDDYGGVVANATSRFLKARGGAGGGVAVQEPDWYVDVLPVLFSGTVCD